MLGELNVFLMLLFVVAFVEILAAIRFRSFGKMAVTVLAVCVSGSVVAWLLVGISGHLLFNGGDLLEGVVHLSILSFFYGCLSSIFSPIPYVLRRYLSVPGDLRGLIFDSAIPTVIFGGIWMSVAIWRTGFPDPVLFAAVFLSFFTPPLVGSMVIYLVKSRL